MATPRRISLLDSGASGIFSSSGKDSSTEEYSDLKNPFRQALQRCVDAHEEEIAHLKQEICQLRSCLAASGSIAGSTDDDAIPGERVPLQSRADMYVVKQEAVTKLESVASCGVFESAALQRSFGCAPTGFVLKVDELGDVMADRMPYDHCFKSPRRATDVAETKGCCVSTSTTWEDDLTYRLRLELRDEMRLVLQGWQKQERNDSKKITISEVEEEESKSNPEESLQDKIDQRKLTGIWKMFGFSGAQGNGDEMDHQESQDDVPSVRNWRRLMQSLWDSRWRQLYCIREPWMVKDTYLRKAVAEGQGVPDLGGDIRPSKLRTSTGSGSWPFTGSDSNKGKRTSLVMLKDEGSNFVKWMLNKLQRSIVMHPISSKRILWTIVGAIFILYDLIILPMQVFDLPESEVFAILGYTSQVYWTCDIAVSFVSGVYIDHEPEMRLSVISKMYMKSWFLVDMLITVPSWLILLLVGETGSTRALKLGKASRILRMIRLARVLKCGAVVRAAMQQVNSPGAILVFEMATYTSIMVGIGHWIACGWYFLGKEDDGERQGWATNEHVASGSVLYQYLMSMHWAFANFQGESHVEIGTTLEERAYSVFAMVLSMIILSCFVSCLTSALMQYQSLSSEQRNREQAILNFLHFYRISPHVSGRVKKYVAWRFRQRDCWDDSRVFEMLPTSYVMDLLHEVRAHALNTHKFFARLGVNHPSFIRHLCYHAFSSLTLAPGENVFLTSEQSVNMYFVSSGSFRYKAVLGHGNGGSWLQPRHLVDEPVRSFSTTKLVIKQVVPVDVEVGMFVSEAALWADWLHRGDLHVSHDSVTGSLLSMSSQEFCDSCPKHCVAHAEAVIYARQFMTFINTYDRVVTDIIDPAEVLDDHVAQRQMDELLEQIVSPVKGTMKLLF